MDKKVEVVDSCGESHTESESNEDMTKQVADSADLKDGVLHTKFRDDKTEEQVNAKGDLHSESQGDDTAEGVHENPAHRDLELQGEETMDKKEGTHDTDLTHGDRNGEEVSILGGHGTELKDYSNDESNDAKVLSVLEREKAAGEIGGASPDLHEAVEEKKVIQHAGNSSFLENCSADEIPTVQASADDLKGGSTKDYQSQISFEDKSGDYDDKSSVVVEPEKTQRNNAKKKEVTQVTGEQKSELVSSSGKSVANGYPPVHPAGIGRAAPLLEPSPQVVQQPRANGSASNTQSQQIEEYLNGEAEEYDDTRQKLQMIRVKFLRLAHRLGQTPRNLVVVQVLCRLGLAEHLRGRNGGHVGAFCFDRASAMAEQLEAVDEEPLDFSCTIMVLGKTGVGKSATINSIFDDIMFNTDAFDLGTKEVQDAVGTVHGIKVRVIDTPGLLPSWSDREHNEKILSSVKSFTKKIPPDIVLYLDRLDIQSRDFSDMPLLQTITAAFGPSIWFNAIVVLTHAASAPPEGPNGTAYSYDMFVTQRSHVVQQAIHQAAGDMRLMNPVSLVENHSACRINRAGQRVLPNGQVWKPYLLLLSFASKILAEANALLKLQDIPPGKPFTAEAGVPPLPFLLSSLLQSRPQLKLPKEQFGDEDSLDDDIDESPDSEGPNGTASSYNMFVTQRSHVVQQAICQAAGDMRLMNPVSLVESHSACRINRAGQRVLPNGQFWKPHLLLLSFASKILAKANALLKFQDIPPGKPFPARARAPLLPFPMSSSLLQSRPQLKLPEQQFDNENCLDDDIVESSDSDDETEPDDLPPFKRLTKAQLENLSIGEQKAYFDEFEHWGKLFMKKQLKEESRLRKMMKKMAESAKDLPSHSSQYAEEDSGGDAFVPVPLPDLALPSTFDSDNSAHQYGYLGLSNQWLVRPVLETHGWDHDVGYEGLNVERLFIIKGKIPLSFSGQVSKDKKDANVQMEVASSVRYGKGKATSIGFDMQTVGKDLAYTLCSETRFRNFRRNMAMAALSFTLLGEALSAGVKVENKFVANKFRLVVAGGAIAVHGNVAVGCNVQSQIPVGRCTNLVAQANINDQGAGHVGLRLITSEQLQIVLVGLIPLLKKILEYSQQLLFER